MRGAVVPVLGGAEDCLTHTQLVLDTRSQLVRPTSHLCPC
jgi:hypothetical protein